MSEKIFVSRKAGEILIELLLQCGFSVRDSAEKFQEAKAVFDEVSAALEHRMEEGTE